MDPIGFAAELILVIRVGGIQHPLVNGWHKFLFHQKKSWWRSWRSYGYISYIATVLDVWCWRYTSDHHILSEKENMEFELKRPAAGKKNKTLIYQHLPSGVKKTLRDGWIDTLDPLGSFGWSRYMYIYTRFRFQLFFVSDLICPDNFWDDFPSLSIPSGTHCLYRFTHVFLLAFSWCSASNSARPVAFSWDFELRNNTLDDIPPLYWLAQVPGSLSHGLQDNPYITGWKISSPKIHSMAPTRGPKWVTAHVIKGEPQKNRGKVPLLWLSLVLSCLKNPQIGSNSSRLVREMLVKRFGTTE